MLSRIRLYNKRGRYKLQFSEITYYEPIDNSEMFLKEEKRVSFDGQEIHPMKIESHNARFQQPLLSLPKLGLE
jgi:hypothetical protein